MTAPLATYTARWVFPIAGPPLERGTVSVRGTLIEAVEPHGTRSPDVDLGNAAIIPGLVNPHTHLDLSGARGLIPPTDPEHFTDWLKSVIAYRRGRTTEEVKADIEAGLAECMHRGTTLLGDIAAGGVSWDSLVLAPLRSVVFREMIGLSASRVNEESRATIDWMRKHPHFSETRPGLSPHAPYSVHGRLFVEAWMSRGYRDALTSAVHLAESPDEAELLYRHGGPFATFLKDLGLWFPDGLVRGYGDLFNLTRSSDPKLFIHGNYLPVETQLPANSSIVYCPRTHAAFGHSPHPFREFMARGVRVCLGTDGLVSNPDLDVLAEACFVHERHPDVSGELLLKMVTLFGAEALGWADETGSLEPGKSADFVVIPLPDRELEPYPLLFQSDLNAPRRTLYRGAWRD